jgi:hypothetical protein
MVAPPSGKLLQVGCSAALILQKLFGALEIWKMGVV